MNFLIPHIFIPNNTPSSKNSKRIARLKNGKTLVINSKTVMEYKKVTGVLWSTYKKNFKRLLEGYEAPYYLGVYFVRDSARKYDYCNIIQIILDLMQEYEWIDNDDTTNIIPVFLGTHIDTKKPGCYICIVKEEDYKLLKDKYVKPN